MGKKRKNEHGAGTFRNSPFSQLKGVAGQPARASQGGPEETVTAGDADEQELFLRSVSGARRITEGDEARQEGMPDPPHSDHSPGGPGNDSERILFQQAMRSIGAASFRESRQEDDVRENGRSASSRLRQLKKGTIRIGAELDLHGLMRGEALQRLAQFIASAYARGLQAVLVITGKGTNSADGPVLPGAVAAWLRGQGRAQVAEFHSAPRDRGGSGALVVFLRRR